MLRTKLAIATMMMGMLATARPVLAHHSFTAEYDFARPITLQGTVVKWELINPHGWITVDVKDANGKVVRWAVETGNPNALLRAGWRKDSLKPGDEVTIEGYLAKDGTPTANGVQVTLADGRKVLAASSVTNGR
jgi:DNA/RNA endonuclease YhcR with UshA esterase domain